MVLGKDWRFLYNRYVRRIRMFSGEPYKWSFCKNGTSCHEESFLEPFILRQGEVFLDVGANIGAWSIRASPYYNRIIAFEPSPIFTKHLRRSLRLNKVQNVSVHQVALGDHEGFTMQRITPPSPRPWNNPEWTRGTVPTQTLDFFHLPPSIIKVDVEGAATNIVQSGIKTILANKPRIIIEVHNLDESRIPSLLPYYSWQRFYKDMPHMGDWLYRENGKQVFLRRGPGKNLEVYPPLDVFNQIRQA